MANQKTSPRIFVAGATGFLGTAILFALLEAGASVTALVPEDAELRLPGDYSQLRVVHGDAWNRGSLIGRSRGHRAVIHAIGSLQQNPAQGHSYHYLNVDSTQNITRMAISDGVPHFIFVSSAGAPWLPAAYIHSKREAEAYVQRSGVRWTIVRAPLAYPRGHLKNPLLLAFGALAAIPILGRPFTRWAPQAVPVLARGLAQLALSGEGVGKIIYGHGLRQFRQQYLQMQQVVRQSQYPANNRQTSSVTHDDEAPFGWLP